MKCQREYPREASQLCVLQKHILNGLFNRVIVIADVGADILDLAETMITSNGLQYEPVSEARLKVTYILYYSLAPNLRVLSLLSVHFCSGYF